MKGMETRGVAVVGLLIAGPVAAIALDATVGQNDAATTVKTTMPHMSSAGMGGMPGSMTQAATVAK